MNVPINDDFEKDYKVEAWKGFDLREVASLGITAGIAAGTACCLRFLAGLPLITSFYIGLIPAVPFAVLSFFRSRTGQTLPELLETVRYWKATEKLAWRSMEYEHAWKAYRKAELKAQDTEKQEKERREKEWAREEVKLEAMKKAYKKRIRKKHREEMRNRKKEKYKAKSVNDADVADAEEINMNGSKDNAAFGREILIGGIDSSPENINFAGSAEPGEDVITPEKDAGVVQDIGNIAGTGDSCTAIQDETWDRIQERITQIRCLSAELEESTRMHRERIEKKGS